MKKITKILMLLLSVFVFTCDKTYAAVNDTKLVVKDVEGVYAVQKYKTGGSRMYFAHIYEMHKNNKIYIGYCIQLGEDVKEATYNSTSDYTKVNISKEDAEYIKLVAYYGYKYSNHNEEKFYLAAQEIIWERLTKDEIYWVSEEDYNGPQINVEYEKSRILDYVNKHNLKPEFEAKTINYGEKVILEDKNKVMGMYKLISASNCGLDSYGGKFIIKTNSFSDVTIKMERIINNDNKEMFYYTPGSQNIVSVGVINNGAFSYTLKNQGVKIKVNKKDYDNKENILKKGFAFKIYDETNKKYICINDKCEYETNEDGVAILPNVVKGKYKIEEIDKKVEGYLYNSEVVEINVDDKSVVQDDVYGYVINVDFYNKKPTGQIIINKTGEKFISKDNNFFYEKENLANVELSVITKQNIYYNGKIYKKDEVVATIKTDKNGIAKLENLPLGEYEIKEIKTLDNYILDTNKYTINLKYKDQYTEVIKESINLNNELKKGKLYFSKVDGKDNTSLAGVIIAIYNEENKKIYETKTDKNGNIYIDNLAYGTYYIKEIKTLDNYVLSDQKIPFTLNDNNKEVKLVMKNNKIELPPKTSNKKEYNIPIIILSLITFFLISKKNMI